jgi:hypothetical protein
MLMKRSPRCFRALIVVGLGATLSSMAPPARADDDDEDEKDDDKAGSTKAGLDLEYVFVEGEALDNGAGGALRLGREFDAALLTLTPEIGASYHSLNGVLDASLYRGFAGLRLSILKVIEPGIFAHVGYGHIDFRGDLGPIDPSHGSFTYDVGATLDFTLLPVLDVGAHAAYNGLAGDSDFERINWVSAGGHATVQF